MRWHQNVAPGRKIGNSTGGSMWECSETDFARGGYIVQRFGQEYKYMCHRQTIHFVVGTVKKGKHVVSV